MIVACFALAGSLFGFVTQHASRAACDCSATSWPISLVSAQHGEGAAPLAAWPATAHLSSVPGSIRISADSALPGTPVKAGAIVSEVDASGPASAPAPDAAPR